VCNIYYLILKEYTKFGVKVITTNEEKWNFEKILFFRYRHKQLLRVPAILTALTHQCCVNNNKICF